MKVAVLGASGRTGELVIEELLKRGHTVNALSRRQPTNQQSGVSWFIGDAINEDNLRQCIDGADAVISALGHTKNTKSPIQTDSMSVLLKIIGSDVKIISLTGTGVRQTGDKPSIADRAMNYIVKLIDPKRIDDGIQHANILKNSNADWKILRVLKLMNGQSIENVKLTSGGPARVFINRITVAKLLVDLAEVSDWSKQMPVAS